MAKFLSDVGETPDLLEPADSVGAGGGDFSVFLCEIKIKSPDCNGFWGGIWIL